MTMVYSQKLFDIVMNLLDRKQKLLMEYYNITVNADRDKLADEINDIVGKRQMIITQLEECEIELTAIPKKLFGNDSHALMTVLKHKVPPDTNLPPILATINEKCIIIQKILEKIKEADKDLYQKVQLAKQDIMNKIEQVKNSKQVFYYKNKIQGQVLGNMLDEKR